MNRITSTVLAVAIAGAAALTLAAPAHAAPTLDSAKQAVSARIDKRLAALEQFDSTIGRAGQLTAAHKDTLTKLVADQRGGLTALKTKVQGETTAAALKADARSMVDDYRVFMLTGPKVRLTAAIDTELAVAGKLGAGADAVKQSLNGQADKLLAVKPGPDAEAIKAAVTPVRAAAKQAHTDLKALRKTKK
ncbi:hypothetical protein [Dactylosporangium sp. NPDC051541]|uniref:hypothetical protein n=1 Tax=Dactylosporangium sp. NPDC051541 TaxID=3363977 RepID=UPI003787A8F3